MRSLLCMFIFSVALLHTQAQDASRLHEMGKNYLVDGDFSNAESLLSRALQLDSTNQSIIKDLALCLYFQKDYSKALFYLQPLFDSDAADEQAYQICGNVLKSLNRTSQTEQLYRKGLKKFSNNGVMYNELGELLWMQNNTECIELWEKGIEKDPSYVRNYVNASRYYHEHQDPLWAAIYGEIAVNMDPLNKKTPEWKNIVYRSYQQLLTELSLNGIGKEKSKFEKRVLNTFINQKDLMKAEFNTSVFVMIRTRFLLDWYKDGSNKFPFRLFEYHRYLLQKGMFESYNRWLFGSTENLAAFQNWTQLHDLEYSSFINYQNSNLFKIPVGQYYK